MGLLDVLVNREPNRQLQYAKMLNGFTPIFSQFGQDVYASDLVQMCVDAIATEISKLQPRHIRTEPNGMQSVPKTTLNRMFRFKPNPLMTMKDFLEKTIWLLYKNHNAFIYPIYETVKGGINYTALYPLNPTQVTYLQDPAGEMFVKMTFANGQAFTLAYSGLIHLRKKFSENEIMGGGANGQPDNRALLKTLEVNDTILQGLPKAIKTSLGVRGILKTNTMIDNDKQKANLEAFENQLLQGDSSIVTLDLKNEYTPLKIDPKVIEKDTMAFVQDKILFWYGVSLKILAGTFTDEEYQAWYERTLEPLIISFGQAFSGTLFTPRELDFGNEIVFYHRDMMYLSTKSKLELLKTAGEQGLLTDNQKLAIIGYPPLEDGHRRTISLNYISTDIADDYQLKKQDEKQDEMTLNEKRKLKGLPELPGGDAVFMPASMIPAVEVEEEDEGM